MSEYSKGEVTDLDLTALALSRAVIQRRMHDIETLVDGADPMDIIIALAKAHAQLIDAVAKAQRQTPDALLDRGIAYILDQAAR